MISFKKIKKQRIAEGEMQLQISSKWKVFKKKVATYLQKKSELLSEQTKRYILIFFCMLFGGSSVAIIIHSATTKEQPVLITKISKPLHSLQGGKNYLRIDSTITKEEYERVEQFKNYLYQLNDSLHYNKLDSIIKARPLLLDSINLFEKMYLQEK